jgi:hypothetical protein
MTRALKLMTFNVQHLPWLARKFGGAPIVGSTGGGGPEPDPEGRAREVARAILDLPAREQPQVIVFNEVFSEDGRRWLLRLLKGDYPHFIKKLEHPGLDIEEDSGLMLMSKLPFLSLPSGDDHWYKPFSKAAGSDARTAKGVGIVRVAGPFDPTTIAFTHLQASYDAANVEHIDIRADQLAFIRSALLDMAGGDLQDYANGVIVGDLNIKGDPDDTSGEWNQVFAGTPGTFGADFFDGWRASMHPPQDNTDYDPGYTQRDTPTYLRNRYDYQCTRRGANVDIGLDPQHLWVPFQLASEVTDHWPLLAHLHQASPHCTPSTAVAVLNLPAANAGQTGSQVWKLETDFRDEDMYTWVYIGDAGTYSVWLSADLEAAAFRRSDFSHALDPVDTLNLTQLPPNVQTVVQQRGKQRFVDEGQVFAWRDPFFLRLRGRTASISGRHPFVIVRHRGESAATAIELLPHLRTDPGLPLGQALGTNDECWFRAARPERYGALPYDDEFRLDNPNQTQATLTLLDAAQTTQPGAASGNAPEMTVKRNGGAEIVYLVLRRGSTGDNRFLVTWVSPLTYLALDESLRLHVDDETGPDWWGADEIELAIDVDSVNVFYDVWDDADAGEDWPELVQRIRSSATKKQGHAKWIAFTDAVVFDALKTDGVFAHGSAAGVMQPIGKFDRDVEPRIASFKIIDTAGDGRLTAHATISRYPIV